MITLEPYCSTDNIAYNSADHIGLCPANRKELVDAILAKVSDNTSPDQVLKIECSNNDIHYGIYLEYTFEYS
jgi:hypothetical protein